MLVSLIVRCADKWICPITSVLILLQCTVFYHYPLTRKANQKKALFMLVADIASHLKERG